MWPIVSFECDWSTLFFYSIYSLVSNHSVSLLVSCKCVTFHTWNKTKKNFIYFEMVSFIALFFFCSGKKKVFWYHTHAHSSKRNWPLNEEYFAIISNYSIGIEVFIYFAFFNSSPSLRATVCLPFGVCLYVFRNKCLFVYISLIKFIIFVCLFVLYN